VIRDDGHADRAVRRTRRRSLTNVGGTVELRSGSDLDRKILAHALDVGADEGSTYAHVHGFHTYPARMHPLTARRLVDRLSGPDATVLDPFCGSGTVLVEARLLGRKAWGLDANPLAVELSWLKARGTTAVERKRLLGAKNHVTAFAEARRAARAGATHRYGRDDVSLFDPHVLLELDGLRAGIDQIGQPESRRVLSLILSSILTKVSRRLGDTAEAQTDAAGPAKRIASGFTIRLFSTKMDDLLHRLADFEAMLPSRRGPSGDRHGLGRIAVRVGDARSIKAVASRSVDLVVTSPPYPGNYDYLSHHAARLRWLGMDAACLEENEIGARRNLEVLRSDRAARQWERDLGASLSAMSRTLKPDGAIVLLVADSVVSGRPIRADEVVRALAPRSSLAVVATGSQARPHFHGPSAGTFTARPRKEHAIVLRHAPAPLTSNAKTS
jgi:hypothetical protein